MGRGKAGAWGTVRKMRNGRYQASYVLNGVRLYSPEGTYSNENDARGWLADERRDIERDEWKPFDQRPDKSLPKLPAPTVAEYASGWLRRGTIRGATRTKYERDMRLRVLPALGNLPIDQVTRSTVATWWRAMTVAGQNRCHDQTYSMLHAMMATAIDEGLISEQPCRVKGAGKKSKRRAVNPLTPTQVQAVADAMLHPQWRIGVLLGAWCGLRSGELRELRRKDVDVDASQIRVRRAVSRDGNRLVFGPTKSDAGERNVPIPAALLGTVKAHLCDHVGPSPDDLLVYNANGGAVLESTWDRAIKSACTRALAPASAIEKAAQAKHRGRTPNLPDYDADVLFHDLRHTALTTMAIAGATLRELQTVAGHTSPEMALRYQEVAASHLDEVMARVSGIMESAV